MNINQATVYSDKDIITSILNSYFIVDYGYINKVNPDKTVNITHAIKPVMLDGTELPETVTDNVEVLTLSCAGFSIQPDYKAKDRVLIVGLKDFVPNVEDVQTAEVPKAFVHYNRSTIKAIPLCIFSDDAKIKVVAKDGKMTITTSDKIELNGNTKQFVTWAELNNALSNFINALNQHTHSNGNEGSPTGTPIVPMTLDISAAKTKTIVTGG